MSPNVSPARKKAGDIKLAQRKMAALHKASAEVRSLAAEPVPAELGSEYAAILAQYNKKLLKIGKEMEQLARKWEIKLKPFLRSSAGDLLKAQQQLQEMNQSFNMQYLQIQQQMQDESRRFTLMSTIMKTKHDTAKNSISNIR
jgi:hypothetical protein